MKVFNAAITVMIIMDTRIFRRLFEFIDPDTMAIPTCYDFGRMSDNEFANFS